VFIIIFRLEHNYIQSCQSNKLNFETNILFKFKSKLRKSYENGMHINAECISHFVDKINFTIAYCSLLWYNFHHYIHHRIDNKTHYLPILYKLHVHNWHQNKVLYNQLFYSFHILYDNYNWIICWKRLMSDAFEKYCFKVLLIFFVLKCTLLQCSTLMFCNVYLHLIHT
jgi:hypothetical protein